MCVADCSSFTAHAYYNTTCLKGVKLVMDYRSETIQNWPRLKMTNVTMPFISA